MRIATWNIDGLGARWDELVGWLRQNRPDVMGLQETKTDDDEFAELYKPEFEAEGYGAVFHGEPDRHGVAILSRHPLNVTQRGLPEQEGLGSRLLAVNTAGLSFTTVCVPSASGKGAGGMERKLAWLNALGKYLSERENVALPAVLCGDFNVTPEPLDTWRHWHQQRPKRQQPGSTEDERARLRLLKKAGWLDLVRHSNADGRVFSWWWSRDFYVDDKGLRLDHLFGDPAVASRLRCAWSDRSYYEDRGMTGKPDHAPVIADLAPEPTA